MQGEIQIRAIQAGDKLSGLRLGHEAFTPLKQFLQTSAKAYERASLARTYGAFEVGEAGKLRGYITLTCGEVVTQEGDEALVAEEGVHFPYRQFPAVKIARLAVDYRLRKFGIGGALVNLALGIAKDVICPVVGCRFVVVDSKSQSVDWYEKRGFTLLDTPANKARDNPVMFVDLGKVEVTSAD